MKKIALVLTAMFLILSFFTFAEAANVSTLGPSLNKQISSPLVDYSSFVNMKIEKFSDKLETFFKTVIKYNKRSHPRNIDTINDFNFQFYCA